MNILGNNRPFNGTRILKLLFSDNGKVIKALNANTPETRKSVKTVVVEELEVFPPNESIVNIRILRNKRYDTVKVIVVSDRQVKSIEVHRCREHQLQTCK